MAFTLPAEYIDLIKTGVGVLGQYLGTRSFKGGIQQAGQSLDEAKANAMRAILGLYDEGRASLAPYANVGPAALNRLQSIAYHGKVPAPASIIPFQPTLPRYGPEAAMAMAGGGPGGPIGTPPVQPGGHNA